MKCFRCDESALPGLSGCYDHAVLCKVCQDQPSNNGTCKDCEIGLDDIYCELGYGQVPDQVANFLGERQELERLSRIGRMYE